MADELHEGDAVVHERFGRGVVTQVKRHPAEMQIKSHSVEVQFEESGWPHFGQPTWVDPSALKKLEDEPAVVG